MRRIAVTAVLLAKKSRDAKTGHIKFLKRRWNEIRHDAQIFGDDARVARGLQHHAEDFLAMALVGLLVFRGVVGKFLESGNSPARFGGGLGHVQRQKLGVVLGRPRERVNAEETEHMIDAVKMKIPAEDIPTRAPPIEVAPAQDIPAIFRDAPILAPLFGE